MAEYTIDKFSYGGNTYKLQDNVSGYTKNTGTVTSVGISNATNGGLSVSGSPVTGSGSITVGHSNVLTNAQTTQAVYPIAIDKNGHISSYGTAVAIPNNSNWVNGSAAGSVRTINAYTITGIDAVAEGADIEASGDYSHAEGNGSEASGEASHAEGNGSEALGEASHAEGYGYASGSYAHAEGYGTRALRKSQHVFGEYNVSDPKGADGTVRGTYVEIVGKGTSNSARSNARTLDWNGNETLAGKLTLGADPTASMDATTKQYVDNAMTVVTFTPDGTNNNLIISVQNPSSIQNGNEVSY